MIRYLEGQILKKDADEAILLVGGVGYGLKLRGSDTESLAVGTNAKFWVHENIKEDRHDLYGFADGESIGIFEKILSVNGAGPKAAMAILDIGDAAKLNGAIVAGDSGYLQKANGVGKKLADRIILELSGKISSTSLGAPEKGLDPTFEDDEAYQALVSLGYSSKDAVKALEKVGKDLSAEERIKLALRG